MTHVGSTESSFRVSAEGVAAMGRISASSCRIGELDLETVRLVRAYLAARAGGDVPDARWIEAWDRFYTACDPLVRRFARCRCHNASDIDDRVQEVWLAVAAHFLQYDPQRGPFQNWFTVLIRSVLAQQHRSHRPLRQLDDESEERIASREADPTVLCDQVQRRRRVRSAIEELRDHLANELSDPLRSLDRRDVLRGDREESRV